MRLLFISIILSCSLFVNAQNKLETFSIESTGATGTGGHLPFWFTHNQLGSYSEPANWQELNEARVQGSYRLSETQRLDYGTDLILRFSSEDVKPMIIQAYAGLSGKVLSLKAGTFADDVVLSGLSASNGDMIRSLNYRPYPMIRLATSGFIPFVFGHDWLRVKAEYDEGLLTGDRVVERPHLHHKSLQLQFLTSPTTKVTVGMNHYVFWRGTLPDGVELPHDLNAYFRYVLGSGGSNEFLETDQQNVAGNQLGSYLLTIEKELQNYRLEFRLNHPFEDHSGMEFMNPKDNLYTFYFARKKTGSLLDAILFEYQYTKHQSGDRHQITGPAEDHMLGLDNYFNHSVYQSGFTHKGFSMGTPLFHPLNTNPDGIIKGVSNNRVSAFHLGAIGYLFGQQVRWKTLLTYSRNFGTYSAPTDATQFYSMGELSWKSKNQNFGFATQLGADFGKLTDRTVGFGISVIHFIH